MRSDLLDSVWRDGLDALAPEDDGKGRARVMGRVRARRRSRVTSVVAATFAFVLLGGLAFAAVQDAKTGVDLQPPTSAPDHDGGIIHETPSSAPDGVPMADGVVVPPGATGNDATEPQSGSPGRPSGNTGAGHPAVTPGPGTTPRGATPAGPGSPATTPATTPPTTPGTPAPPAPPAGPQPGIVETSPGHVTFTVVLRDGPNGSLVVLPANAQMPAGELTIDFRDERAAPSFVPTLRSTGGPVQQAPQTLTYASGSTAAFRTLRSYDFRIFNGITAVATGPTLTIVEPVLWRDANVEPARDGVTATIHQDGSHVWLTVSGREVRRGEPVLFGRHSPGETMLRDWTNVAPGNVTVKFLNPQHAYVDCSVSHVRDSDLAIRGEEVTTRAYALPSGEQTIELRCELPANVGSADDFVLWVTPQAP